MAFLSTNTLTFQTITNSHCLAPPTYYNFSTINHFNLRSTSTSFPKNRLTTACITKNNTPTSNPSKLVSTHIKIPKILTENAAKLVLGSLILVGSLTSKPVRALPVQNGVNLEEGRQTQKEYVEEEELYEKLLQQQPRNVEALKAVVHVKMRKGKTKEAIKFVEKLIDIEPKQVEWRLLQALCYEMMGQLTKAKRLFNEILKKRPLLLRALHGLAMVMHKNHEEESVFHMLHQALELASRERRVTEERNIKILIAQMHLVKGNMDEALKKYRELIDEDPRDFRPYLCQGIIYSLQDKKKEADEQFEIYKNLVPEEFPQKGFLEDVVLAAKNESREQLEKEFKTQFSYKK